jgi:hypothetical protein
MAKKKEPGWTSGGTPNEDTSGRLFDINTVEPIPKHENNPTVRQSVEAAYDQYVPPEPSSPLLSTPTASHQSLDARAIVYIEGWVLVLGFATEENWRTGNTGYAVGCFVVAAMLQVLVFRWEWAKRHFGLTIQNVTSNGYVWIATLIAFLLFIALSPLVEQKQWPFSEWFASSDTGEALKKAQSDFDSQHTTLIEWLQTAQGETKQARQERDQARQQFATAQSQLQDMTHQRDIALQAAHQPPPPPPPEDQVPIRWQEAFQLNWNVGPKMMWVRFVGQATALARIKDAYIISTLTGHKETLQVVNTTNQSEFLDINQIEPVTSGSQILLIHAWNPNI